MMRSMFSAVSGLQAHQLRMDAIGNNIANVNTVGYKGTRVTFQEVFSQTIRGAGAPQGGRGGTNPQQVGLGVNVASMSTFHVRGSAESTGYNTDLMINGDGFFIVSSDANDQNHTYTRAGNFELDEAGNLITPGGQRVMGNMYDVESGRMGTGLQGLQISKSMTSPPMSTGVPLTDPQDATIPKSVFFGGNLNSDVQPNATLPVLDEFLEDLVDAEGKSSVARDTTFTVYDELGGTHDIRLAFVKTEENKYGVYVVENGVITDRIDHELEFEQGKLSDGTDLVLELTGLGNGASDFTFTVDFGAVTQVSNESDVSADVRVGYKQGNLEDFTIDSSGVITGVFNNGYKRPIGQVAIANFRNPAGLEKIGENMYRNSPNSGEPLVGTPGSGGRGTLNPGTLEMSNVDLSREFTNMITTQRGFQANSRIITTSDEMLQEVVNMKR
ncbi:protein of unknown function DUF1078 domain protein [Alkaliphilus metalliredigens QYMF]|uniref:Flagellar hook protein FlgE n=1 Tax=Alkaliphilus metalliredigens (strain QYMF) TaxID=293826 RepID=A6TRQ0_ALKMQ|nr:flagellar hook protein FlgE [Alkaliphilus metalliredigens]ABR48868.1 protein of unknown function DUF1078 domain protein [Alkaliphilus metalliredigens QYMF]